MVEINDEIKMEFIVLFFLMLIIVFGQLQPSDAQEIAFSTSAPDGCTISPTSTRNQCMKTIESIPGCEHWLNWEGVGCVRRSRNNKRRGDGGCQWKNNCEFKCPKQCSRRSECAWIVPRNKPKSKGHCAKQFSVNFEYLQPSNPWLGILEDALKQAKKRWRKLLLGQGGWGVTSRAATICGSYNLQRGIRIDDLHIIVDIRVLDGEGGILASAAPCVNWEDGTSAVGVLRLDADDLSERFSKREYHQLFIDTLAHEIGHILGIGNKWQERSLVVNVDNPSEPFYGEYLGKNGIAGFAAISGRGNPKVDLISSTAARHWDEDNVVNELMSPFLDEENKNKLSQLSGQSLLDLGYILRPNPKFENYKVPRLLRQASKKLRLKWEDSFWQSEVLPTLNRTSN